MQVGSFCVSEGKLGAKGYDNDFVQIDGTISKVLDPRELSKEEKIEIGPGKKRRLKRLYLVYVNYKGYWPSWDGSLELTEDRVLLVKTKKLAQLQKRTVRTFEETAKAVRTYRYLVGLNPMPDAMKILEVNI